MKTYKKPSILIVKLQSTQHLMDLSGGGTTSVSNRYADDDGFVKEDVSSSSSYNVWDDDWSK